MGQQNVLKNAFSSFHRGSMLQRAMLTALAVQLATDRLSGMREEFAAMDVDDNGRISRQELANSLKGSGPMADIASWVDSVFDSLDTDGSKELEYTEWVAAAIQESDGRRRQRPDQQAGAATP